MPRIRLPKWMGDSEKWIPDFLRTFENYDQLSMHRDEDLTKALKLTDGQGGTFFTQQIKPVVKRVTLSGASVTIASMFPPGVSYGAFSEVITAITGATGFNLGTSADPDAWGNNLAIAQRSKSNFSDYTDRTVAINPIPVDVVITAVGPNFSGGVLEVVAYYSDFVN